MQPLQRLPVVLDFFLLIYIFFVFFMFGVQYLVFCVKKEKQEETFAGSGIY